MSLNCKKCGHEIDGNSPVCMYCGATISDSNLSQEAKERIEKEACKKDSNAGTSIKAFGALLIIIGIIADIISMFLVFSGSYASFGGIIIFGTIVFIIGLAIVSNS